VGFGWKAWGRERLPYSDLQGYLQDQVVMFFASAAARTAELASPDEGMVSYLADVKRLEICDDTGAWAEPTPGRVIGFGQLTSAVGSITAATRLTAMAFSCNLRAGRQYEYRSSGRMFSSVAADVGEVAARVTLGAGSVLVTDPMVTGMTAVLAAAGGTNLYNVGAGELFQVATTGSYQVNLWARRVTGTGNLTFQGTPTGRAQHMIVDRGVALAGVPNPV
jgi:hypothetical protein